LNFNLRHIQHFIAVAEELHFRRAAQLTNVAQPALSRSVQALESELGVQLLCRNNRNVKLTAAGKEFLNGCTDIVESMENTISRCIRADQSQYGGISVGYTYIAMCGKLPQLIANFEKKYSAMCVELAAANSSSLLDQLLREELDCCFLSGPVNRPIAADIDSVVFQNDNYVVIVNHNHPLAHTGAISIEQLAEEKILLSGQPKDSTFNQHVNQFFNQAGITPDIEFIDQNHVGLLGNVALERGVCIATEGYGCVYSDTLNTLILTGINAKLPTLLAWRKDIQSESALLFRNFVLHSQQIKSPSDVRNAIANRISETELSQQPDTV